MKTLSSLAIILLCLTLTVVFPSQTLNAAGKFKLPAYEKFTLANGLTVYLMEQHEVPLITVTLVFPGGAVKDGKNHGLANLTADALLLGTKTFKKAELEEKLDFLGVNYNSFATLEYAQLGFSFLNTDLDKVFPIIKEVVQNPSFDAEEFDKYKKRSLLQLDRAKEQPGRVINAYANRFLYGDHVYGNPLSGFKSSVSPLQVEDLKTFYKANYTPGGSAVAIVGNFKTAAMKQTVSQLFSNWKAADSADKTVLPAPAPISGSRVLLVNKDDARETRFIIAQLGIKRSNPDYIPIQVINTILGGRFTSWLNDELRVNAGLTYGAHSSFNAHKHSGSFAVSSFTKTATTIQALDLALEVLERLHKKGLDAKTLDSAKNYVKGQYPPRYETAGQLAALLTDMFVYDFNESFIDTFQAQVDGLTLSRASEIIKKYFPHEKLQFIMIGKASELRDKIKKYGEVTEKEIKTDGF